MELYYTTEILKHFLLLFLCKVDFLTITIKSSIFPSFLCTCCFIDFKQNVTQKMSPPVAGFVVYLITQIKKRTSLAQQVEKIEDCFSLLLSANIWKCEGGGLPNKGRYGCAGPDIRYYRGQFLPVH